MDNPDIHFLKCRISLILYNHSQLFRLPINPQKINTTPRIITIRSQMSRPITRSPAQPVKRKRSKFQPTTTLHFLRLRDHKNLLLKLSLSPGEGFYRKLYPASVVKLITWRDLKCKYYLQSHLKLVKTYKFSRQDPRFRLMQREILGTLISQTIIFSIKIYQKFNRCNQMANNNNSPLIKTQISWTLMTPSLMSSKKRTNLRAMITWASTFAISFKIAWTLLLLYHPISLTSQN